MVDLSCLVHETGSRATPFSFSKNHGKKHQTRSPQEKGFQGYDNIPRKTRSKKGSVTSVQHAICHYCVCTCVYMCVCVHVCVCARVCIPDESTSWETTRALFPSKNFICGGRLHICTREPGGIFSALVAAAEDRAVVIQVAASVAVCIFACGPEVPRPPPSRLLLTIFLPGTFFSPPLAADETPKENGGGGGAGSGAGAAPEFPEVATSIIISGIGEFSKVSAQVYSLGKSTIIEDF